MRNIIFLGAIASMTACGLSEDQFGEDAAAESCRILVLCDFYDDEAACEAATSGSTTETGDCTYDSTAAKDCLSEMADITTCPDPFALPTACGNVFTECGDSGM